MTKDEVIAEIKTLHANFSDALDSRDDDAIIKTGQPFAAFLKVLVDSGAFSDPTLDNLRIRIEATVKSCLDCKLADEMLQLKMRQADAMADRILKSASQGKSRAEH